MRRSALFWLLGLVFTVAGCAGGEKGSFIRSEIDNLNRQSFLLRYKDPLTSIEFSRRAIQLTEDSLPSYNDGMLRAWNILAFDFFITGNYDSAEHYLRNVTSSKERSRNLDVEQTIAQLLQARLFQRRCQLADCYNILSNISLDKHRHDYLHDYAQSEYYITTLILNYHYRTNSRADMRDLLADVEQKRLSLHCDYSQDMALNYALAYSYFKLCDSLIEDQSSLLGRSLEYCLDNLHILSEPVRYSAYSMADIMQLMAFMSNGDNVRTSSWEDCQSTVDEIKNYLCEVFSFCPGDGDDYVLALLEESTALFATTASPYQRLGSAVSTGNYLLNIGDSAAARAYYSMVRNDTMLRYGFAPKMEAALYRDMIRASFYNDMDEAKLWFERVLNLQAYISSSEQTDYNLYVSLENERHRLALMRTTATTIAALSLALIAIAVLLARRTKALRREQQRLNEARKADIERIANVETCLSVLRHDMSPFVAYLSNPSLPEEMKNEVVSRLIKTFDNIKNWTQLSLPQGLRFHGAVFAVQKLFEQTATCIEPCPDKVALTFHHTEKKLFGDSQLLLLLLRNLVNNAMQHTVEGAIDIVANSYEQDPRFIDIEVKDSGCGMSAEEIDNLFRTDKTIKEQPKADGHGSGFGLILCRYIIKLHDDNTIRGCRIWAESSQGSTFHCLLASGDAPALVE